MGSMDKFSHTDFHSIVANRPSCDAYSSQEFIKPTTKPNDSELSPHLPIPISNYPPLSIVPDYPRHSRVNSAITLNFIEQMLMQEETDDKVRSHHREISLRTMEEPFYKLLGQKYPVLSELLPHCSCDHLKNLNGSISKFNGQSCCSCSVNISSSNYQSNGNLQAFQAPWSFSAIVGEAKKFTQGTEQMETGLNINGLSITQKPRCDNHSLEMNATDTINEASFEVRGRKNCPFIEDFDLLEGRSNKQFAISSDEQIRNETFDKVLLCSEHKPVDEGNIMQGAMTNKPTMYSQNDQQRTTARRKTRGKRQQKKEVVDLRALLIHCAQAVAVNDNILANDTLKRIRQHSSPSGDDSQRLAFFVADCLAVRLAGTGSQVCHNFITKQRSAADILKLIHLCFTVCPFLRASYYFSNKTILDVSKGKPRLHIIDFGICFGFQWPSLFEQLAIREDGPPRLRITGIELLQPGFRPYEMSKNTGLRLVDYANMFKVPFEYRQISSKWETISIEDFDIEKDEVLVINCIHRMKNLGDETISINCARNRVLNTIRMMKPEVFVHGVTNGPYSTPFFLPRFKEAMYHYTALFDILDKTTPRDNETRMIIERDIYRYAILNVIACEGSERIERPESYKNWKLRNLRANLEQLPLNPTIVKGTQDMVRQIYHKDFFVDKEDQWLVLGWKGRILYALSTWKPNESDDGY